MNISAIILTYNEEIHIRRCIENLLSVAEKIFVIDCFSTDATINICKEYKQVHVIQHEWPGNQAEQFNWALNNCPVKTEWILRLDADEYLMPESLQKLKKITADLTPEVNALSFILVRYFLGKRIKQGTGTIRLVRMFRTGKARYENRLMDEHMLVQEGIIKDTDIEFADNNLNNLEWWITKHLNYAKREARILLDQEHRECSPNQELSRHSRNKRRQKNIYARIPLFWRSFFYFCYRYFLRLGFLDGKEGFLWHFLQGWWYRTIVDEKIYSFLKKQK